MTGPNTHTIDSEDTAVGSGHIAENLASLPLHMVWPDESARFLSRIACFCKSTWVLVKLSPGATVQTAYPQENYGRRYAQERTSRDIFVKGTLP